MATYTLHVRREARPGEAAALEDAQVVRDGFSWWAFVFQILWFLRWRLWLGALIFLIASGVLGLVVRGLHVHPTAASAAELLLASFFALEANAIRRWTLTRRGRPMVDAVIAGHEDEAEAKLFARWLARKGDGGEAGTRSTPPAPPYSAPIPVAAVPASSQPAASPAVGLFPEPEGGR